MIRLAHVVLERPRAYLALILLAAAGLATGIPLLEIRTDGASLYPEGDEVVRRTDADRRTFHDPEEVILLASARPGGPLLASPAGFRYLREVHRSLEALPWIGERGVQSLASVVDLPRSRKAMEVRSFLEQVPEEGAAFEELMRRIRGTPLVDGLFLARDGQAAALYASLAPGRGRKAAVAGLEGWADAARGPFELRLLGPVVAETLLGEHVLHDLAWLTPAMVGVMALLLYLTTGTPGGVIAPLVKVLVCLVSTFGLMGHLGIPVSLVTTVLPVLLVATTVTDEIHILSQLARRLESSGPDRGRHGEREELKDATATVFRSLEWPLVMTSLTTGVGFLSFTLSEIRPLRMLGLAAGAGVLLALLLAFTLTPALLMVLPRDWFRARRRRRPAAVPPLERRVCRSPRQAFLVGLLLLAAAVPGLGRLTVQDSWVDNFDPASSLACAERAFNRRFWGSYRLDVILTGAPGSFRSPAGMALIEAAAEATARGPGAGGAVSVLVPLRPVADFMGLKGGLPALEPPLLSAVLDVARYEGRHTAIGRFLSADDGTARVMLFLNSPSYGRACALRDHATRQLRSLLSGQPFRHHLSGDIPVAIQLVHAIVTSQLRSIALTLVVVYVLLLAAVRSPLLAGVVLLPVAAAATVVLGGMGWTGLPLGIATSMFAALTVGVGVDLAMHLFHAHRRQREGGRAGGDALLAAIERTGPALRWNTLVLAAGFLVLTLSALRPNHTLGALLCAAVATSYVATLLYLPWPLWMLGRRRDCPPHSGPRPAPAVQNRH